MTIGHVTPTNAVVDREAIFASQAVPNCVFWCIEIGFHCDIAMQAALVLN